MREKLLAGLFDVDNQGYFVKGLILFCLFFPSCSVFQGEKEYIFDFNLCQITVYAENGPEALEKAKKGYWLLTKDLQKENIIQLSFDVDN